MAITITAKTIEVLLVETSFIISCDAGIASGIEMQYELIHEVKEVIFVAVAMASVEPVDLITTYRLIMGLGSIIAYTCMVELLISKECGEVISQV